MTKEPRPEVVQAVLDALLDGDLSGMLGLEGVTPEERARIEAAVPEALLATEPHRRRQGDALLLLAEGGGMRAGMSWADTWETQSEANRVKLVELYDSLPEGLLPHVDARRAEQ